MRSSIFLILTFLLIILTANINNSQALVEDDCRFCHSANLSDMHHWLILEDYECLDCHPVGIEEKIKISDCLVCHPVPADINHGDNCTDCHLEGGTYADLNRNGSIISKTGFINSVHYNITGDFNSSNYTEISKVCWGCHVNYTDQLTNPVHSKNSSQLPLCEDCHDADIPLNSNNLRINPIQIPEHQSLGEDVQTDTSTNCTFCHKNSLSIPVPTTNVTHNTARNFVSHYLDIDHLMTTTNNTTECMWCHYENSNNVSWGEPINPNSSSKINHTFLNITNNSNCYPCHFFKCDVVAPFTFHDINMTPGAGKDCLGCHDLNTTIEVREKYLIDVPAMNDSEAIHFDLNRGSAVTVSENNVRCWACHGEGDGSEASQPRSHPSSVHNNNPGNCSDMDCHNVNQSVFNEPMVHEHFKNVDEIDENISTEVDCPACHLNSVLSHQDNIIPSDTSLVSHYGSTPDLINTTSCIYCHLDEDNAEEWGNAPDPTDNISRFSDTDWEIKLYVGDKWHLGNRYFLTFDDITADGDSAHLRLYQGDILLEDIVIDDGQNYTYEADFLDSDDAKVTCNVLELNFTAIFRSSRTNMVEVEARLWKRIHPEDDDASCWACHMDDHVINKNKYLVLDKNDDQIYYVEKLLDFSDNETHDKEILSQKHLVFEEGVNMSLEVEGDYLLTAKEVDINGKSAFMTLTKSGSLVKEGVYKEGEYLEYEEDLSYEGHEIKDVVTFSVCIDSVFHGQNYDAVIITDVKVVSGLMGMDDDEILGGYNTSQLHINDTFSIGGIPDTFHVPLLNEGLDGGSDCIYCHDVSNGFGVSSINATQSRLGGHSQLNSGRRTYFANNDINKACWACHGDGADPGRHPANYLYPRLCEDCHVELEKPTYIAVDLSDEPHGQAEDCSRCHGGDYPGLHVINIFEPLTPYIDKISARPEVVKPGQPVELDLTATAGWNMKVRGIEYFIDSDGLPGTGTPVLPRDGIFDEQMEEAGFIINTTGLELGNYTVYVHSMERDNKWGPVNKVEFSIDQTASSAGQPIEKKIDLLGFVSILLVVIGFTFIRKEKPSFKTLKILLGIIIILSGIIGLGYIFQMDGSNQLSSVRDYQELDISGDDCDECHIEIIDNISLEPGRHSDLKCVYCHPVHTHIESCINCHAPHGTGLTYEDCLNCHPAHIPHEIDYPESVSNNNCALCHEAVSTALDSSTTKHSTLQCAYCHSIHGDIPECNVCHAPHTQDMSNNDCLECHPAHDPTVIEMPAGTQDSICAACHNDINSTLYESKTEHKELGCIYCHPEHRYLPTCESCHGLPHLKAIHEDYPVCMQCHIISHDVKNIMFAK